MSDNPDFGFGKFVPGFEFLQNLAKGSSQALPQMPSMSNWVAPTLNLEDLQKRIDELKTVQFWLDQNGKALGATVQALELQKMTLATLKGMNLNMAEVAEGLQRKTQEAFAQAQASAAAPRAERAAAPEPSDPGAARAGQAGEPSANERLGKGGEKAGAAGLVDPLQWWGALTQQFQEIAAGAMKDAGGQGAMETARNLGAEATQAAMKMAGSLADAVAPPARKASARKAAARKAPARKAASKPAASPPRKGARGSK